MNKDEKALKTIGEVVEITGIAPHILRFWESKFSQLNPQKRRGIRYYSNKDIEIIVSIKNLLYKQSFNIEGAKKALKSPDQEILKNLHQNLCSLRDRLTQALQK